MYYIHFVYKNGIESTVKIENETDFSEIVADWCGCGYKVKESGNVAFIYPEENIENDLPFEE